MVKYNTHSERKPRSTAPKKETPVWLRMKKTGKQATRPPRTSPRQGRLNLG